MTHSDRTLLARELHDGIAQDLVSVGYALDVFLGRSTTPPDARIEIREIRFQVDELINKVRNEIHELQARSGIDFAETIRQICENYGSEFVGNSIEQLDSEIAYQVVKIFTEIIRNIHEHANSTTISVTIELLGDIVSIVVKDNGEGEIVKKVGRYGIESVETRVKLIGGALTRKRVGEETETKILFPYLL